MSGSKIGGIKTARTVLKKYGKDYYHNIGRKGGAKPGKKGFAANHTLAILAGSKGGRASRKGDPLEKENGVHKLSLCNKCNCMTKTYSVSRTCAKCGGDKR